MKTRKPLAELIPDIIMTFERYREQIQFDLDLYQMYEGQVKKFVEDSLKEELISHSAYRRAIQRIPSVNIAKKVTDKLSKVYAEAPIRFTEQDQDLVEQFSHDLRLNGTLGFANQLSNLNKRCALELYTEEGQHKVRVLAAHQFFVYSDSVTSPTKPTVFIKLLGREQKRRDTVSTDRGKRVTNEDDIVLVNIFALYSDDEFMIIDSDGSIRQDKMAEMGITSTVNPFGVIPFVYVNKSRTELIPYPNQTAFDMGVLIPKLLTDLNYSAQFLSHSVIWTVNADLQGAEINPDAIVNLGDSDGSGNTPTIGTIDPKTDIEGVLRLIEAELSVYLTTEGLNASGTGKLEAGSSTSGISKLIDESDTTEVRKEQQELFRNVEVDFWRTFSKMQEVWAKSGVVENKDTMAPDFLNSFSIKFAEIKPMESEKEKYDKIKVARDMKLITKKQALKELFPNLSDIQIQDRLDELVKEGEEEKEKMLSMGLTPGFTQLATQQQGVAQPEANSGSEPE